MEKDALVYVAGHRGLVGSSLERSLRANGFENLVLRTSAELDLRDQSAVATFFKQTQPRYVFMSAARVGGILANESYPARFLRDNLTIASNVIHSAYVHDVEKLLFLGSTCIYPKLAPQPMPEDALLCGPLEPTNQWYAIAKIAGLKMCQAYRREYGCRFICALPTNLYGPGDNFDATDSHVLPALLRKFHEGMMNDDPAVTVWGTGTPRREFLYVDDCADACLFLMQHYDDESPVNVGVGKDVTIAELSALIADVVGYSGEIIFDRSKPDGAPRKLVDTQRINELGWRASTPLRTGIERTYAWFLEQLERGSVRGLVGGS